MKQLVIIPCSGIDSVYGLISQEIAIRIVRDGSQSCGIMDLAYLVNGDAEAADAIEERLCVAINGCSRECASNMIDFIGGEIAGEYNVKNQAVGIEKISLGTPIKLTSQGQELAINEAARILEDSKSWGGYE